MNRFLVNLRNCHRRHMIGVTLALVAAFQLGSSRAQAQRFDDLPLLPFTGVIVVRQEVTPALPKELERVNLQPPLTNAWRQARDPLAKALKAELLKRKFGGQTLHDLDVSLGSNVTLQGNAGGNIAIVQMVIPGNRVTTKITTPDIIFGIGLDRGADPRFAIDFDIRIKLKMNATLNEITVMEATVAVSASKPRGTNFTGWLAQGVADIIDFFGGPDVRGKIRDQINSQQVNLSSQANAALKPLNKALAQMRPTPGTALALDRGSANGALGSANKAVTKVAPKPGVTLPLERSSVGGLGPANKVQAKPRPVPAVALAPLGFENGVIIVKIIKPGELPVLR